MNTHGSVRRHYDLFTPETHMWRAVVVQQITDALSQSKKKENIALKRDAWQWLLYDSHDFFQTCYIAGLNPDELRKIMMEIKEGKRVPPKQTQRRKPKSKTSNQKPKRKVKTMRKCNVLITFQQAVEAVKSASMMTKSQMADQCLDSLVTVLEGQERRLQSLEALRNE